MLHVPFEQRSVVHALLSLHWPSLRQATHWLVCVLQRGVLPPHCESLTQATHIGGVAPLQTPPAQVVPRALVRELQRPPSHESTVHSTLSLH